MWIILFLRRFTIIIIDKSHIWSQTIVQKIKNFLLFLWNKATWYFRNFIKIFNYFWKIVVDNKYIEYFGNHLWGTGSQGKPSCSRNGTQGGWWDWDQYMWYSLHICNSLSSEQLYTSRFQLPNQEPWEGFYCCVDW